MYDQLPMQVSLMERERELKALLKDAEILRVLGYRPVRPFAAPRWLASARARLTSLARQRAARPGVVRGEHRAELGPSAAA